ncbi:MAG TPA: DUF2252 family protein [Steroidobacteraceae bacterium]|nr:DUF2252 family protein [Steroidobacteraceae bacterium]
MDVRESTRRYEAWLARTVPLVRADLDLKHQLMAADPFSFLRATFYRWAEQWPEECAALAGAPAVLAVGDLHIENFGTWRDAEGRLIWGVNDFDETVALPYTQDLVRLATSALLAIGESQLALSARRACNAIVEGYEESLRAGGGPAVLAERYRWLRDLAIVRLKDQRPFWNHLRSMHPPAGRVDPRAQRLLRAAIPADCRAVRLVQRRAGLGSLGRVRVVALANWRGGMTAREVKPLAPSAWLFARRERLRSTRYAELISRAVRAPDPFLHVRTGWLIRRLAPDCSRIELASLPRNRDEARLLWMMGWETANVHLGTPVQRKRIIADLRRRKGSWLAKAAGRMAQAVERDWRTWRKSRRRRKPRA